MSMPNEAIATRGEIPKAYIGDFQNGDIFIDPQDPRLSDSEAAR